jgi:hypothetical protein
MKFVTTLELANDFEFFIVDQSGDFGPARAENGNFPHLMGPAHKTLVCYRAYTRYMTAWHSRDGRYCRSLHPDTRERMAGQ